LQNTLLCVRAGKLNEMKKRGLFIIVWLLCFPLGIIALIWSIVGMIFVAPFVWVITGDEDKAWQCGFEGKVPGWFIDLPYKIIGEDEW